MRFKELASEEELAEFAKGFNTCKNTEWALRMFCQWGWNKETGNLLMTNANLLGNSDPDLLNTCLSKFVSEAHSTLKSICWTC